MSVLGCLKSVGSVSPQIQSVRTWWFPRTAVKRQFQFGVKRYVVEVFVVEEPKTQILS